MDNPNMKPITQGIAAVQAEYADDTALSIRYRTHVRYTLEPVDFVEWTIARLAWQGTERVLDVGCGPGDILRTMIHQNQRWGRLVGCDFSPGMIRRAVELSAGLGVQFLVADAQALPFPDESFDVVMARHMLPYVPDIERAIAEAVRVLRPGGQFLATANGAATMPEYESALNRMAAQFPGLFRAESTPERFTLENGPELLAAHLGQVETHVLRGTLCFPEARPFVEYVASSRLSITQPAHTEAEWQAALDWLTAEVQAHIARHGHFDVTKITGAVMGTKEG